MKLLFSFPSVLALISFAAASPHGRGEGVIRCPLNRKTDVVGQVDLSALKAHLIGVSK